MAKKKYGMARIKELLTLPSAEPMYVLNIIDYKDFNAYRWYGVAVLPVLKLAGGQVHWTGYPSEMLHGEAQCQSLMLVCYPSHRHFVRMIANPYYVAINKIREKAVKRFEGAFSEAQEGHGEQLCGKRTLLALHFNTQAPQAAFAQAKNMLQPLGATPLLSLSQYMALDLMPRPKATDPNPLTYQRNMFFAIEELSEELRASLNVLAADLGDCRIGVYKSSNPKSYLPGQLVPAYFQ